MYLNLVQSTEVSENTESYNTCQHDPSLLPPALRSLIPTNPPNIRTIFFGPWTALIFQSRKIDPADIPIVTLTPHYAKTLRDASTVATLTLRLSESNKEDLLDPSPFDHLFQSGAPQRYFARYDLASPKDSPCQPLLTSAQAVVDQLATSHRSNHAITDALNDGLPICVYFTPWDDAMDTRREYRVFCPPTSVYHPHPSRVTAVSQYSWHTRSILANLPRAQLDEEVAHLLQGVERVHAEIMVHSLENGMHAGLNKEGFVFDVYVYEDTREVRLLELNPFGVTSSCGSCLFNWVTDAETLYGGKDEIEVRLAV
ncbi:hypothetical protein B0H17DRAFT_1287837 [Mycena rosella]|uniref:Cell division cycle protein 123 n=1 Tax=Mycena rosella TaxID=1033263 RepID=A0AAD7GWW7_MYCRO|nr:hypothetical protein B0H17DRAFT_1287837 [Mycena rosella]